MSMDLTGEAKQGDPEMHPLGVLLPEFASFMDMVKEDFTARGLWTEYDQGLRDRIAAYNISKLHGMLGQYGHLLHRSYEAGWVQCATWAERDDLITDCDSGAYVRERDAALAKLATGVAGTAE